MYVRKPHQPRVLSVTNKHCYQPGSKHIILCWIYGEGIETTETGRWKKKTTAGAYATTGSGVNFYIFFPPKDYHHQSHFMWTLVFWLFVWFLFRSLFSELGSNVIAAFEPGFSALSFFQKSCFLFFPSSFISLFPASHRRRAQRTNGPRWTIFFTMASIQL